MNLISKEQLKDYFIYGYWSIVSAIGTIIKWLFFLPIFLISEAIKYIRFELPYMLYYFYDRNHYGDIKDNVTSFYYMFKNLLFKDAYKNYKKAIFKYYPFEQDQIIKNVLFTAIVEFKENYAENRLWTVSLKESKAYATLNSCYTYIKHNRDKYLLYLKSLTYAELYKELMSHYNFLLNSGDIVQAEIDNVQKFFETQILSNTSHSDHIKQLFIDDFIDILIQYTDKECLKKIISIWEYLND